MSLVYLASPYSNVNPAVRELRYDLALAAASSLLAEGIPIFSPIVYGKHMEKIIGTDYLSWKKFNDAMLDACTSMIVLQLDGWENSKGIVYELEYAKQRNIPVSYMAAPEFSR